MKKTPRTSSKTPSKTPDIKTAFLAVEKILEKHGRVRQVPIAQKSKKGGVSLAIQHIKRTLLPGLSHRADRTKTAPTAKKSRLAEAPRNLPLAPKSIRIMTDGLAAKRSPYVIDLKEKRGIIQKKNDLAAFLQEKKHKRTVLERSREMAGELFLVNLFQLLGYGILSAGAGAMKLFELFHEKFSGLRVQRERSPKQKKSLSDVLFGLRPMPPLHWKGSIVSFFAVGLLLTLPFRGLGWYDELLSQKNNALRSGNKAVSSLLGAATLAAANSDASRAGFEQSITEFEATERILKEKNGLLVETAKWLPVGGETIVTGEKLLKAGKNLATAGEIFTEGLADAQTRPMFLTQKISALSEKLEEALPLIEEANALTKDIRPDSLPEAYRENFIALDKNLPVIIAHLRNLASFSDTVLRILGHYSQKRYLVFFQNNAELRPTGGFLGSFALVDIDRGEIKNLEIPGGGTYDMNGGLSKFLLAPEPLHLVNARWQLQDANWFPDFPASAEKMMWFYEKSGGPTVDGVLTLTPDVVERILNITGPIDLSKTYGIVLNAENFWEMVQKEAEKKYDETRESKKIIADLTPLLLERIFQGSDKDFFSVLSAVNSSLAEKQILLSMRDETLEKKIRDFGWGGEIKSAPQDYLAVFDTNISGGKTDRSIRTSISAISRVEEDGSIINTVTVSKTHTAPRNTPFTGIKNTDYMRVYVPRGSVLLETRGFLKPPTELFEKSSLPLETDDMLIAVEQNPIIHEKSGTRITEEFGKTVFGNWIEIEPESTTVASITYKLPFGPEKISPKKNFWNIFSKENPRFFLSFLAQKQPGTEANLSYKLVLPPSLGIDWSSAENTQKNSNVAFETETTLANDKTFSFLLK